MLFKKSMVKRLTLPWLTLLKIGSFLSVLWFGYWSIYWELIYWKKPLDQAFFASLQNWILLATFLFLFFAIMLFQRKVKNRSKGSKVSQLFSTSISKGKADSSGPHYTSQSMQNSDKPLVLIDEQVISATTIPIFGKSLQSSKSTRRKLHIPFWRRTKRILSGCLLVLYVLLSIVAFPSLLFPIFIGTAYILFDYLRKTRRTSWEKPKK